MHVTPLFLAKKQVTQSRGDLSSAVSDAVKAVADAQRSNLTSPARAAFNVIGEDYDERVAITEVVLNELSGCGS